MIAAHSSLNVHWPTYVIVCWTSRLLASEMYGNASLWCFCRATPNRETFIEEEKKNVHGILSNVKNLYVLKTPMKWMDEFDDRRALEEMSWPQGVNIKSCVCACVFVCLKHTLKTAPNMENSNYLVCWEENIIWFILCVSVWKISDYF